MPLIYHQQHSRVVSKLSPMSETLPSPCNHMYRSETLPSPCNHMYRSEPIPSFCNHMYRSEPIPSSCNHTYGSEPLPSSCNHTYGREISSCLNVELTAIPVEECKKYPCWTSTNDSCPENTKPNSYRSCLPQKIKSCSMELTPQALHISDTATLERKRHKRSKAGGVNKGLMSWFSAWQHRRAARKATK